jgi:hypothetical protein
MNFRQTATRVRLRAGDFTSLLALQPMRACISGPRSISARMNDEAWRFVFRFRFGHAAMAATLRRRYRPTWRR